MTNHDTSADQPTTTAITLNVETRAYLALEELRAAGTLEKACLQASIAATIAWTTLYVVDDVDDDFRVQIPEDPATALDEIKAMLEQGIQDEDDLRTQLRLVHALEEIDDAIRLLAMAVSR